MSHLGTDPSFSGMHRSTHAPGRNRVATTDPTSSDFAEAAYAWIDSAKAPKFAEGLLNGKRVKVPEKEILADVRSRIWERVQRPHDELDAAQAGAYCRAVARNLVNDLLRGFRDEDLDERLYYRKGVKPVALNDLQPVAAESAGAQAGEGIDDLRTWFEASGHEPWVVSGALTYVTVGSDPDCDYSAAPKPRAGAAKVRALLWPSLWYAGKRRGLFPTSGPQVAAQRQALKRTGDRVLDLVNRAAAEMLAGGAR